MSKELATNRTTAKGTDVSAALEKNGFAALRMLCALVVVYAHLVEVAGAPLPMPLGGREVEIAVDIFFILSGYWILHSFRQSRSTAEFFRKRFWHIVPLYLIVIVATALGIAFFSELSPRAYFTDPAFARYLCANAVFLNFLQPSLPGFLSGETVNGALWTLKVEWAFYALLPVFAALHVVEERTEKREPSGRKRQNTGLVALFAMAALATILIYQGTQRYGWPYSLNYQIQRSMLFFACGMFWYQNRNRKLPGEALWVLGALAVAILSARMGELWLQIVFAPALTILARAFVLFARAFFAFPRRWDISYPLYLVHFPIIQILRSVGLFASHLSLAVVLGWILSLAAGTMLHLGERHFRDAHI